MSCSSFDLSVPFMSIFRRRPWSSSIRRYIAPVFHCHSLISFYSNSRDIINIIILCVILILALTVTHGQRSNFAISLPVSGLPFLLLAPRLSPRSFIRKLYKGESGEIYYLPVPRFCRRHHCWDPCAPLSSCTAPVRKP
jgi:hypothetical protein